jgi:redox-sensitive bicupin YhaK (pirin superfamily)
LANIEKDKSIEYKTKFPGNGVYFFVIEGEVEIDGKIISKRDAIGVWEASLVEIKSNAHSEILAIEIPMLN